MMKGFYSLLTLLLFVCSSYSQNIGLRGNTEFSDNRKINNAIGFGGYLNLNDFSEKFELLFSLDFNQSNKQFTNEGIESTYARFYFSTGGLYVLSLAEKSKIKIGLGISYNKMNATEQGILLNWTRDYEIRYIGAELMTNIHFQKIFRLPINFDIFITPAYLIYIKYEHNLSFVEDSYSKNLKILNIQMGISYKIK